MFIKLTQDDKKVVYVNTQHIIYVSTPTKSRLYSSDDKAFVMLRDDVSIDVKETTEEIMALMDERV